MLAKITRGIRTLLSKALREHSSPHETGLSIAVGAFCACTPFLGFHLWLALGLATVLRLNRVWAAVGSRATSVPLLLPLVVFSEIELAHRLRMGAWVPLSPHEVLTRGRELLLDWGLGTPLVGLPYAALLGVIGYALARARLGRLTPNTPGELPRPSSGSPPSAPPTPSR